MDERETHLRDLGSKRLRIAGTLTAAMIALYFGFIALIAFARPFLATTLAPGLTVGIVLGVVVIVVSWLLTWWYVRWANRVYDVELAHWRSTEPRP